jgi:hypothetical protein
MLKNNALLLLTTPAAYFLSPLVSGRTIPERAAIIAVTMLILAGIVREARERQVRPAHFVLPFYVLLVLVWNYPQADRFLIPFLPLFVIGIWLEGKRLLGMVRATLTRGRLVTETVFAMAFAIAIVLFTAVAAANYAGGDRTLLTELSRQRGALLEEKREAYSWLSRSTSVDARVVAYEDASLYLYSGRMATRPLTLTTADFFDPSRLGGDLDHITDVPRAIGAEYWVFADDDYRVEWPEAYREVHERTRALEQVLSVVYRSRNNRVRVYSFRCVQHPDKTCCCASSSGAVIF